MKNSFINNTLKYAPMAFACVVLISGCGTNDGSGLFGNDTATVPANAATVSGNTGQEHSAVPITGVTTPSKNDIVLSKVAGQQVSLQISNPQPNNGPFTYSIHHGPDGMTVDSYGTVSWNPTEPMFEDTLDVYFGVNVHSPSLDSIYTGKIQLSDPSRLQPIVRQGMILTGMNKGMHVVDMDNDSQNEIVTTASSWGYPNYTGTISIFRFDGINYVEDWTYPFEVNPGKTIDSITVSDLNEDFKPDIVVTSENLIAVIDGATRKVITKASDSMLSHISTEVADLDGDGIKEIITLAGTSKYSSNNRAIQIFDAVTLTKLWESTQTNLGSSLAIGNVDNDTALEIVTSEGFVFDGKTKLIEWSYGTPFGFAIDTGDLNADGVDEIVSLFSGSIYGTVRTYSMLQNVMLNELTSSSFYTLAVSNIDADLYAEIIVGQPSWGNVTTYDGYSLTQQGSISTQGYGVSNIGVGDTDNDGQVEILWATGLGSTAPEQLIVTGANQQSLTLEWSSNGHATGALNVTPVASPTTKMVLDGPFYGGYLTTLSPGQKSILFASATTSSGYNGSRIISIDPLTGTSTISSEQGSNWNGRASMCVVDYDGDGVDEAFLATSTTYSGYFTVYDFNADLSEWNSGTLGFSNYGVATTNTDINGDGFTDMVSITKDGYAQAWDVLNQSLIWQSTDLGFTGYDVAATDLSGNEKNEIITATTSNLLVFEKSGTTYTLRNSTTIHGINVIETGDIDGDGRPEIFVGDGDTTFYVLDGLTLAVKKTFSISGIVLDLLYDKQPNSQASLLVSTRNFSGSNEITKINPTNGSIIWKVSNLIGSPQLNSVHLADTNGNGKNEIMMGTDKVMYITR